jgi:hypothetical protein
MACAIEVIHAVRRHVVSKMNANISIDVGHRRLSLLLRPDDPQSKV